MKYQNTKLRTLSVKGNTDSDKAINMWNKMNWEQRFDVSRKVKNYKSITLKQRACINYVAEYML